MKKRKSVGKQLAEDSESYSESYADLFADGTWNWTPHPMGSNIKIRQPEYAEFHPVAKPAHYAEGRQYETIDVLLDWFSADPLLWQVGKYISRAGRKGDAIEDLEKAKWYLEKKIQVLKEKK